MLIFFYSSPRVDLGFHNTRGVLYPNTQPKGLKYGPGVFLYTPLRGLGFPQHTRTTFSVTHHNRVCPVSIVCDCVFVHAPILITGVYCSLLLGLSPAPRSSKT